MQAVQVSHRLSEGFGRSCERATLCLERDYPCLPDFQEIVARNLWEKLTTSSRACLKLGPVARRRPTARPSSWVGLSSSSSSSHLVSSQPALSSISNHDSMSPYGATPTYRPSAPTVPPTLVPRTFLLPGSGGKALTVFPVTRGTVSDELVEYLRGVFNEVVAGEF
jgi:hypothetical protein